MEKSFFRRYILPFAFTLRIRTVSRIGLDYELNNLFKKLKPGIILDVGSSDSPYKKKLPFKKYLRLDIDKNSKPDICCDIHDIKCKSDYFDVVLATEVLEHCHDPVKVVSEIYRILKPGGVCILSTRFIHPYHPHPHDYYRFTWDSLNLLFKKFSKVNIHHHGNLIQSLWHMINYKGVRCVFLNIFNPLIAMIRSKKTNFPCGFVVYAIK